MSPTWEIEITHDGIWPFTWSWVVRRRGPYGFRCGDALTKDRARRKALKAKRSMENEDVAVVYAPDVTAPGRTYMT